MGPSSPACDHMRSAPGVQRLGVVQMAQRPSPMREQPHNASTRSLRLIGQGREAEVFECPDGRVLKLLRAGHPAHAETLGEDRALRSDLFIRALLRTPYGGTDRRSALSRLGDSTPGDESNRRCPG